MIRCPWNLGSCLYYVKTAREGGKRGFLNKNDKAHYIVLLLVLPVQPLAGVCTLLESPSFLSWRLPSRQIRGLMVVLTVLVAPKTHLWALSLRGDRVLCANTNPKLLGSKAVKTLWIPYIIHGRVLIQLKKTTWKTQKTSCKMKKLARNGTKSGYRGKF